jgi:hypothetical protein
MQTVYAIVLLAAFTLLPACAHDSPANNLHSSIRKLGKDVTKVVESAKSPDSESDPTSFRARIHQQILPLRQQLEKLRERTNTQIDKDDANGKDATAKEDDRAAKMQAELDQMEQELNAVDMPESGTPP